MRKGGAKRRKVRVHGNSPFPPLRVSVLLVKTRKIVERRAVQGFEGPNKIWGGSDGICNRGMKLERRWTKRKPPQPDVQELVQEQ